MVMVTQGVPMTQKLPGPSMLKLGESQANQDELVMPGGRDCRESRWAAGWSASR